MRWRKEETTIHDGFEITASHVSWEAKVKQGGDFLDSQFVEAKGRDAVEDLMAGAGVCRSIYDLSFQVGFVADRVGWTVNGFHGETIGDDTASMSLVLDTVSAALEGRDGEHQTLMHHQVGELELEANASTSLTEEGTSKHRAGCASQAEAMRKQLNAFMSTYPALFEIGSLPVGKITAYKQQQQALAARWKRANAINRLANMSEVRYERLSRGLRTERD